MGHSTVTIGYISCRQKHIEQEATPRQKLLINTKQ